MRAGKLTQCLGPVQQPLGQAVQLGTGLVDAPVVDKLERLLQLALVVVVEVVVFIAGRVLVAAVAGRLLLLLVLLVVLLLLLLRVAGLGGGLVWISHAAGGVCGRERFAADRGLLGCIS